MSSEKIYPKGLISFKKNDKAPKFVLGTLVISMNDFYKWAKENSQYLTDYKGEKQLKLQVTEFDGRLSFSVDTWKPEEKKSSEQSIVDDLPF